MGFIAYNLGNIVGYTLLSILELLLYCIYTIEGMLAVVTDSIGFGNAAVLAIAIVLAALWSKHRSPTKPREE